MRSALRAPRQTCSPSRAKRRASAAPRPAAAPTPITIAVRAPCSILGTHPSEGAAVKNLAARARQLSKPYRVEDGKAFRLRDVDPADTAHLESADADRAREALQEGVELL